ncbi:D-2-hydroxyacid dehydrogenase [Alteraurantiacibacter aquimixticola]|uniref:D-2-hydroxyacid dehydrogenase n=1 Tax=Alteraurantiacibacter aquimixticola TaxID=2489173 RepID=A0A4T3F9Z9_9SPHN|nr:D-2-hydroxyacid dehydrogenase [Alteraurantiacibacter aquimixticola]TIX51860.1 D-2-hydroxyacid dehydrogenase [Alteraurantiacibacter aquimixticola]
MTKAVLPARLRPLFETQVPEAIEPLWWETGEQLVALAPEAEIGWFDMFDKAAPLEALRRAKNLKWLNTIFAGVDWMPLDDLAARGVTLTNGSGINANVVAEFTLMAMLAFARNHADIVRCADRHEWRAPHPGRARELAGSKVLVMGYGAIGQRVGHLLQAFDAEVTPMRRSAAEGALGPDEWQARIGEFDWVVLAMPGTEETRGMISAEVIAAMKPDAVLVNVARADIVDQDALIGALHGGRLGGAILDLTDPEPLPPSHPLWDAPGAHITMHAAGLPTKSNQAMAAKRFLENCARWKRGEPLISAVDLARGY